MNRLEKGDTVIFKEYREDKSWWGKWAKEANLKPNKKYEVADVSTTESHDGINVGLIIKGHGTLWHCSSQFRLPAPEKMVIILRRGSDDRTIRAWLQDAGFHWASGDKPTSKSYFRTDSCRVIMLHPMSKSLTWSSQYGAKDGARFIRKTEESKGVRVILNTKPSVTQTINELKKYF